MYYLLTDCKTFRYLEESKLVPAAEYFACRKSIPKANTTSLSSETFFEEIELALWL
jgi:hypothetical protein